MLGISRWTFSPFALLVIFFIGALSHQANAQAQPNTLWAQLAKIGRVNGNRENPPWVAISGETVVVSGALGGDGAEAYVFARSSNRWTDMKLVATLRSSKERLLGLASVATDGQTVVVGDIQCVSVDGCDSRGVVYVFVKPAGGWTDMTQTATLTGSDTMPGNLLGWSVGLSGSTIVAGADGPGGNGNFGMGAAYVFVKPASGWTDMTETAKLTASDASANAAFGYSVAIDGGLIAVGAPEQSTTGKAYVFVQPTSGWRTTTQTAELTSTVAKITGFGASMSVQGDTVVVGDFGSLGFHSHGAVFVFVKPPGGWSNTTQNATLTGVHSVDDGFGYSVGIGNNLIVVGAPDNDRDNGGTVFVFPKPADGWSDASSNIRINASDAKHGTAFGNSLAVSGNIVVAGTAPHWPYYLRPAMAAVYLFQVPANP